MFTHYNHSRIAGLNNNYVGKPNSNKIARKQTEKWKVESAISNKAHPSNLIDKRWEPQIESTTIQDAQANNFPIQNNLPIRKKKRKSPLLPSFGYLFKILIWQALYAQGASGLSQSMLNGRGIIPIAKSLPLNEDQSIRSDGASKQNRQDTLSGKSQPQSLQAEQKGNPALQPSETTRINNPAEDLTVNDTDDISNEETNIVFNQKRDTSANSNIDIRAKIRSHMYNGATEENRISDEVAELFTDFIVEKMSSEGREDLLNAINLYEMKHPNGQFFIYKNNTAGMMFSSTLESIAFTDVSIQNVRQANYNKLEVSFKHELFHAKMHHYANQDPASKKKFTEYLKQNKRKRIHPLDVNVNFGDFDLSDECVNMFYTYVKTLDNLKEAAASYPAPKQNDIIELANLIEASNPALWGMYYQRSVNAATTLKDDLNHLKVNFIRQIATSERSRMQYYINRFTKRDEEKYYCGEGLANRGDRFTLPVLNMMHKKFGPPMKTDEKLLGDRTFQMVAIYEERQQSNLLSSGIITTALKPEIKKPYAEQSFEERIITNLITTNLQTQTEEKAQKKLIAELQKMKRYEASYPASAYSVEALNVEAIAPKFKFVDHIPDSVINSYSIMEKAMAKVAAFDKNNNVILINSDEFLKSDSPGGLRLTMKKYNLNVLKNLYAPSATTKEIEERKEYLIILNRALQACKNSKNCIKMARAAEIESYNLQDVLQEEIERVANIPENDAIQFFSELLPFKVYKALEAATDHFIFSQNNSRDIIWQQIQTEGETNKKIQNVEEVKKRSSIMRSSALSKEKMFTVFANISTEDKNKLYKASEAHKSKNPNQPIFIDSESTLIPFGKRYITVDKIIHSSPKELEKIKNEDDYLVNQKYLNNIFWNQQTLFWGKRDTKDITQNQTPTSYQNLSPETYNLIYYSFDNDAFSPQYKINVMEELDKNPSKITEFIDYINQKRLLHKNEIPFKNPTDVIVINDNGVVEIVNRLLANTTSKPSNDAQKIFTDVGNSHNFKDCIEDINCKNQLIRTQLNQNNQNPSLSNNILCTHVLTEDIIAGSNPQGVIEKAMNCFKGEMPVNRITIHNDYSKTICSKQEEYPIFNCQSQAK